MSVLESHVYPFSSLSFLFHLQRCTLSSLASSFMTHLVFGFTVGVKYSDDSVLSVLIGAPGDTSPNLPGVTMTGLG